MHCALAASSCVSCPALLIINRLPPLCASGCALLARRRGRYAGRSDVLFVLRGSAPELRSKGPARGETGALGRRRTRLLRARAAAGMHTPGKATSDAICVRALEVHLCEPMRGPRAKLASLVPSTHSHFSAEVQSNVARRDDHTLPSVSPRALHNEEQRPAPRRFPCRSLDRLPRRPPRRPPRHPPRRPPRRPPPTELDSAR